MADLAGLRAEVLSRLGLPDDDGMAASGDLDRAINAALTEYTVEGDWPWLATETTITTAANDGLYPLPAGFLRGLYAYIGDQELQFRSAGELIVYAQDTDQPRYITGGVGQLKLVPTPNGAYSVVFGYVQSEAELVDDTDTPLLPAAYHDYLVVKAARKMAERIRDGDLLQMLRASEQEWYIKLKGDQRRTASLGRIRTFFRGV